MRGFLFKFTSMYSYLFFGLSLLGVFSIFENLKGGQKLSFFKINIIYFLILITIASAFDFLFELGYDYYTVRSIIRLFGFFAFINLFYLVAMHKIPKIVIYFESLMFVFYIIALFNGFQFISIHNGKFTKEISLFYKVHFLIIIGFILFSMAYNLSIINKRSDSKNLYHYKIKRWTSLLIINFIFIVTLFLSAIIFYFKKEMSYIIDTRMAFIVLRFIIILFILFRPRFIDESGFSFKFKNPSVNKVSMANFEFLFFGNHYFLKSDANLEDFALKMNKSKSEINTFIKENFNDSFSELLNKNRVNYFKSLLQSKQHEAFTIEALSEMSGFNNRQSMYNAFKKYEGTSPSEFINNL